MSIRRWLCGGEALLVPWCELTGLDRAAVRLRVLYWLSLTDEYATHSAYRAGRFDFTLRDFSEIAARPPQRRDLAICHQWVLPHRPV